MKAAKEVLQDSIDGMNEGKYVVAAALDIDPDIVEAVLASYVAWLSEEMGDEVNVKGSV